VIGTVPNGGEPNTRKFWVLHTVGLILYVVLAAAFIAAGYVLRAHRAPFWMVITGTLAYCAAIFSVSMIFARAGRNALAIRQSEAAKRYVRRFLTTMSLYAVVLVAVVSAFVQLKPHGVLAYTLALAPAVPLVASIVIIGIYLREESDEFERNIQNEAALLATGAMMVVATVWGFLEQFHLAPSVPSWAVFPLWALMLGPAQMIVRRRYR
jgi:archaellum biogenesis protein FlaJ (TadC family)